MKCPYCEREPKDIPEYVQQAKLEEMTPTEYVRFDEGTYHVETDLFCCTDCYIKIGMPLNTQLIAAFRLYKANVRLKRR